MVIKARGTQFPKGWRKRCGSHGHLWSRFYFPVPIPGFVFQMCQRKGCKEVRWA